MTLMGAGRRDEGITQIEEALIWDPLNPTGIGIMACNAIELGNREAADHWMRQVDQQPRLESTQVDRLHAVYREAFGERWDG